MPFRPTLSTNLIINNSKFHFSPHPVLRGSPYGQIGKRATVYQIVDEYNQPYALKVFFHAYRSIQTLQSAQKLQAFASLPGLQVCSRTVITQAEHSSLILQYPDLEFAVMMPWVGGKTWFDLLDTRQPFTMQQSHSYTRELVDIFTLMEKNQLAHCDISSANVFLDTSYSSSSSNVALVDVEEMYSPNLQEPRPLPEGTDGYAHKLIRSQHGIWNSVSDRFAGAILLAEILGWQDINIRNQACDTHYFDQAEVQTNSPRYQTLHDVLQTVSPGFADLFKRAWFSQTLSECPTFSEWSQSLEDFHPISAPSTVANSTPISISGNDITRDFIARGRSQELSGNFSGAIADYEKALVTASPGLRSEINLMIVYALVTQADQCVNAKNYALALSLLKNAEQKAINMPVALYPVQTRLAALQTSIGDRPKPSLPKWAIALLLGFLALGGIGIIIGGGIANLGNKSNIPLSLGQLFSSSTPTSTDTPTATFTPSQTFTPSPTLTPLASPTALFTATPPSKLTWSASLPDSSQAGPIFSMASAPKGQIYLAYLSRGSQQLRLAQYKDGKWQKLALPGHVNNPGKSDGWYPSVEAGAEGNPNLFYYSAARGNVRSAFQTSDGTWSSYFVMDHPTSVFDTALVLDKNFNRQFAVIERSTGNVYVRIATDASNYSIEKVGVASLEKVVDKYVPIAFGLTPNHVPYLCYASKDGLDCGWKDTDSWHHKIIDPDGIEPSLKIDSEGNIHLAYYNTVNRDLMYVYGAAKDPDSWQVSQVDTSGDVGQFPSLALYGILPQISYYDATNNTVKVAIGNSGGLYPFPVASGGPYSALSLDSNGNPYIAFYNPTTMQINFVSGSRP